MRTDGPTESGGMDGRTDGRTDISKVTGAFSDYANAPKILGIGQSYAKSDLRLRIRRLEFALISHSKGKFQSQRSLVVSNIWD